MPFAPPSARSCRAPIHFARPAAPRLFTGLVLAVLMLFGAEATVQAQDLPPQRQIRTFIPPEQLVNFLPDTPFNQFLESINPIFLDVTNKRVIDPESRSFPINVSIVGMQFFDALELVLEVHGLTYRETDQYFIIEDVPIEVEPGADTPARQAQRGGADDILATARTREIRIEAVMFEINRTKSREQGVDWGALFGQQQQQQSSSGQRPEIEIRIDDIFNDLFGDRVIVDGTADGVFLNRLVRFLESNGFGRTIASPSVTVQSGEQGRIQIGSDIPVIQRDFAGNTLTQFVSTGVIIRVVPTLIADALADTAGAPLLNFMHLDVTVERSNGRPFGGSVAIDRSGATTQVLLLDGEMTVIGGLHTTDDVVDRRGIPFLKDLPWYVFGLRYLFGFNTSQQVDRELIIVLQAHLVDPLPVRAARDLPREVLDEYRNRVLETLRRFDSGEADDFRILNEFEEEQ